MRTIAGKEARGKATGTGSLEVDLIANGPWPLYRTSNAISLMYLILVRIAATLREH